MDKAVKGNAALQNLELWNNSAKKNEEKEMVL